MSENELEEKLKELQEKGIIRFSEWRNIDDRTKISEIIVGNTKMELLLIRSTLFVTISGMMFYRLKEIKIKTESELFGSIPVENNKLYFVFINFKDDPIAYIPLRESEVSK